MTYGALFPERSRFYERRLPGGGYIAIEVEPVRTFFGGMKIRGEVVVERRQEARRQGHRPPIVAATEQEKVEETVHMLLPFAKSDSALATMLDRKARTSVTMKRLPD